MAPVTAAEYYENRYGGLDFEPRERKIHKERFANTHKRRRGTLPNPGPARRLHDISLILTKQVSPDAEAIIVCESDQQAGPPELPADQELTYSNWEADEF